MALTNEEKLRKIFFAGTILRMYYAMRQRRTDYFDATLDYLTCKIQTLIAVQGDQRKSDM